MLTIIKSGEIFAPRPLGRKDILVAGSQIAAVVDSGGIKIEGIKHRILEAEDCLVTPGFIDSHVHILGGGGEGGPATRAPEIQIEDILSNGVTTLIGCLGTDGITRHMESLLAKANGLELEGITTYIFSGSYEIPVKTITGSVRSDLILIEKIIGAGEIALSDHRSSQPTFPELAGLAAECRVGGMLGGKAGILHCHLGDGPGKLDLIFRIIEETEIPSSQIVPTHCNRSSALLEAAVKFIKRGGTIDLTAGADPSERTAGHLSIAESIAFCLERQAPLEKITISSDGNGSMPVFDRNGNLTGLTIASQSSLPANFSWLIRENVLSIDQAVQIFTANPANCYHFTQKGEVAEGKDADLLILDREFRIVHQLAKGRITIKDGELLTRGTFAA